MKVGLFLYATADGVHAPDVGKLAEDYELESLFVCEHSHVPSGPDPYADPDGRPLPAYYSRLFDPIVTLGAIATCTSQLLLGTAVCLVAQRDPITTAKAVATLDQLSRGRMQFGVGAGWNLEEARAHGVDPRARFRVLRDKMLLIRDLWTKEAVELPGLGRIAQWPRPFQRPHPPVLVAGNGPAVFDRVAEFGTGWLVTHRHPDLPTACRELDRQRQLSGRRLPATIVAQSDDVEQLRHYAQLGIDRALLPVRPAGYDDTVARIRQLALVSRRLLDVEGSEVASGGVEGGSL
jgi:probable F420-dependent oxidoreductase